MLSNWPADRIKCSFSSSSDFWITTPTCPLAKIQVSLHTNFLLASLLSLENFPFPPLLVQRKFHSQITLESIISITLSRMMMNFLKPLGMIEATTQTSGAPLSEILGHSSAFWLEMVTSQRNWKQTIISQLSESSISPQGKHWHAQWNIARPIKMLCWASITVKCKKTAWIQNCWGPFHQTSPRNLKRLQ